MMRVGVQKKLPVKKDKMTGSEEQQYEFWRHFIIENNTILDEIRNVLNRHADKLDELEERIEDIET